MANVLYCIGGRFILQAHTVHTVHTCTYIVSAWRYIFEVMTERVPCFVIVFFLQQLEYVNIL